MDRGLVTYVRLTEAAQLFRVHHSTLYRWVDLGQLDYRKFRNKIYVNRQQAEDMIATRRGTLVQV